MRTRSSACVARRSALARPPSPSGHAPLLLQRLTSIVAAVPGLGAHSRVVDVGTGTGCLVPHLQSRGVQDILAVDVAANMLAALQRAHPPPSTVGNDAGECPLPAADGAGAPTPDSALPMEGTHAQ